MQQEKCSPSHTAQAFKEDGGVDAIEAEAEWEAGGVRREQREAASNVTPPCLKSRK